MRLENPKVAPVWVRGLKRVGAVVASGAYGVAPRVGAHNVRYSLFNAENLSLE